VYFFCLSVECLVCVCFQVGGVFIQDVRRLRSSFCTVFVSFWFFGFVFLFRR
jgi:hypothetical protein